MRSRFPTTSYEGIVLDISARQVSCLSGHAVISHDNTSMAPAERSIHLNGQSAQGHRAIEKGQIIDPGQLERAIQEACHSLEAQTGRTTRKVYVILPPHCVSTSIVSVELAMQGRQVQKSDVQHLIDKAVATTTSQDVVLHGLPMGYQLDKSTGIRDPRGLFGAALSTRVMLLKTNFMLLKNYLAILERCHVSTLGFLANPLCTGLGVLSPAQQNNGSCVIDIGSEVTTLSIFHKGSLIHTQCFSFGGNHLTTALCRQFHLSWGEGERLKTLFGTVMVNPLEGERPLSFSQEHGALPLTRAQVADVLQPLVKKLALVLFKALDAINPKLRFRFDVVMTGGGAQLTGILEYFSLLAEHPLTKGHPFGVIDKSIVTPGLSDTTAIGALHYVTARKEKQHPLKNNIVMKKISRLGLWFKEKVV